MNEVIDFVSEDDKAKTEKRAQKKEADKTSEVKEEKAEEKVTEDLSALTLSELKDRAKDAKEAIQNFPKSKEELGSAVKDRLKKSALGMSGGQQQRLCIARALAVEPEVILMDEPTSALDPISTSKIEDLAVELRERYTIVMVTHNMQQATRISDYTAFFLLGEMVEYDKTETLFSIPKDKRTEDYITGRFG